MIDRLMFKLTGIRQLMGKLVGLYVLQAFLVIGQSLFLSYFLVRLWRGHQVLDEWPWLAWFVGCYLARHALNWLASRWLDDYARQTVRQMRQSLLAKLFVLGPQVVQREGTGNMVTLALDGISQVEEYITLVFSKMINMMIAPILILIVTFYLDLTSGIVMVIVYPLIILFFIILGLAAQARADRQFETFQLLSNHFIDSLRGIDTLKYFGLSKPYSKSIYRSSENFRLSTMATLRIAMTSTFALDFFTTLSIAMMAVFLGFKLIDGEIGLFPALGILIMAPEYFLPLRNFANDYHATLNGKNSFQKIMAIINEPSPKTSSAKLHSWSASDQLQVDQVAFQYGEDGAQLKPLSFTARGYQKIGIIGMSGSGKTTLINLLSGFLQAKSGQFVVQGQAMSTMDESTWREQITYIPQSPYLFDDTLRNNIAFYTPDASDEQIQEAVKVVGMTDLVNELPEGLDTMIGTGERALSGGQAQRIALARAFLDQSRKVMIFDEPTAHLDLETEIALKEAMLPLMKDHLVFFATHRLHWMRQMDYILVMDHGQLVEQGTCDELMAHQGSFVKLVNQMKGGETDA